MQYSKINLSWNTTPAIYQAIKLVTPMCGLVFNQYGNHCAEKWLDKIVLCIDRVSRPHCITTFVDPTFKQVLESSALIHGITRSEIIHLCVEQEIKGYISKWGCKTPQQFVDLMTSKTPLKLISKGVSAV
jgi:hypothetical protein